jgi:hypothetical protein
MLLAPLLAKKCLTEEQLRPVFAGMDFKVASSEEIKRINTHLAEQRFYSLKENHLFQSHGLKSSHTSESHSIPPYHSVSVMSQELKHKPVSAV